MAEQEQVEALRAAAKAAAIACKRGCYDQAMVVELLRGLFWLLAAALLDEGKIAILRIAFAEELDAIPD